MEILNRLSAWWQARQRGEVRVAPEGVRGRVFAKKEGGGSAIASRAKLKPDIALRVFRQAENAWYRRNPDTGQLEKEP